MMKRKFNNSTISEKVDFKSSEQNNPSRNSPLQRRVRQKQPIPAHVGIHHDHTWMDDKVVGPPVNYEEKYELNNEMNSKSPVDSGFLYVENDEMKYRATSGNTIPIAPNNENLCTANYIDNNKEVNIDAVDVLNGYSPLLSNDANDDQRWVQSSEKTKQAESIKDDEEVIKSNPGDYLVYINNEIHFITSNEGELRSNIESLILNQSIDLDDIYVYRHMDLDFGLSIS